MGELVPIIALIFFALVIVGTLLAKKNLSMRQVVKPLEEEEFIHKTSYVLTNEQATTLIVQLEAAANEAKVSKKSKSVQYFISADKLIEFVVDCK